MVAAATLERDAPATNPTVTLEVASLARAMRGAASIVATTNTIPILSNVRLTADPIMRKLEIISTDLDTEYRQLVPLVECETAIEATVEARRLSALVSAVDSGSQVKLKLEPGRMVVSAGRSRWVLPVLPATDFPVLPIEKLGDPMTIEPASRFAAGIDRVLWSSLKDDKVRPYLGGIYIHEDAGKLRMAANNGHTMASHVIDVAFPNANKPVILPNKFVGTLKTVLANMGGPAILSWDDKKLRVQCGDIVLTGKLIDQEYPTYQRIIPAKVPRPIIVEPEALRAGVKRVMLVNDLKSRAVKVEIGNARLSLSTTGGDTSTGREDVPADCTDSPETGFNGSYLSDALANLGGDSIEIHQDDPGSPALFKRVVDDGAIFVVMPMRV